MGRPSKLSETLYPEIFDEFLYLPVLRGKVSVGVRASVSSVILLTHIRGTTALSIGRIIATLGSRTATDTTQADDVTSNGG